MKIRLKIRFNFGDFFILLAILFRILDCIEKGYISHYNACWLIILICFEIFCFIKRMMKIKEGNKYEE